MSAESIALPDATRMAGPVAATHAQDTREMADAESPVAARGHSTDGYLAPTATGELFVTH